MGGALLIVAGGWLLCQVLGGDALGRLGISGASTNEISGAVGGAIPGRTPSGSGTSGGSGGGSISSAVGGLIPGRTG